MNFDWTVVAGNLPQLLKGLQLTLVITVFGILGGLALGMLLGVMRAYGNKVINAVAVVYIELIRGTPLIVQVMFIYFALPILVSVRFTPLSAAILAIIINSSAYVAEIVRGAFASVDRGLLEAGLSIGLPMWKVPIFVTGPIAFRRMLPPLGNQFIASLKDTSLFIVIGVGELTRRGQEIIAVNFRAVEIWSTVAGLYLIAIGVLALLLRLLERRLRIL